MTTVTCGQCRFWKPDFEPSEPDEYDVGPCSVMKGVVLPYTWRYATREIMWGTRGEQITCARFLPKE